MRAILLGLRRLLRPHATDRDLDDEIRDYVDRLTNEYEQAGLSHAEAARRARRDVGSLPAIRDEVRQSAWESVVETTVRDVFVALRGLRREPLVASVVIATLAIGIGAATAIFSAVNPILLEPLPYPHADRVVVVSNFGSQGQRTKVAFGTYLEIAARSRAFDALAVVDTWQPALTGDNQPERLDGEMVTAQYFHVLGVAPALGRDFRDTDDRAGAPRVAILSDRLARRHFGSPAAVLGRFVSVDGDERLVIGVMPAGFENVLAPSTDIWAPPRYRRPPPENGPEWGNHMTMVGRLAPSASLGSSRQDLNVIARAPDAQFPRPSWNAMAAGLSVTRLQDEVTQDVRATLIAVLGGVGLLLAIACVNVTNLLVARLARRRNEFAMRAALGAGRARLVRHLVTESVVLAALGGLGGLAVAAGAVRAIIALSPPGLPRLDAIRLDGGVFLFALAVTAAVGLVAGLAPALEAVRRGPAIGAQQASVRTIHGSRSLARVLVVVEVAFALVLLVSACLLGRSLFRLFARPPGFDAPHVLTMKVQAAGHQYDASPARLRFFESAAAAVRNLPGVTSAAFTNQLPLSGDAPDQYGARFASIDDGAPNGDATPFRYEVTADYFATMGIPLRRGRLLDVHDVAGTTESIVLSESFARRLFGGADPIGQRAHIGPETVDPNRPWDVVVGVVGDVKQTALSLGPSDAFYVAGGQWSWVDSVQTLVVRTAGDPAALAAAVKQAIWSVDPNQPIVRVETLEALVARSEAERRFALVIFGTFAAVAVMLAAIGIYGVLSGSVTARRREIGLRAALGASRRGLLGLVLGEGLALAAAGIGLGLGGAALATRAVAALLFDVSRLDPVAHLAAVGVLLVVAATACGLPAWRAVRIDAAEVLRE